MCPDNVLAVCCPLLLLLLVLVCWLVLQETVSGLRDSLARIQDILTGGTEDLEGGPGTGAPAAATATAPASRIGPPAGLGRVPLQRVHPTAQAHAMGEARALEEAERAQQMARDVEGKQPQPASGGGHSWIVACRG